MERDKIHIFLIGFMGSGKTSLGKQLAPRLKLNFLDTDLLIEEQEKSSIQEIFNLRGESHFRELENKLLQKICLLNKPTVFSTGGGMPIFNDNISHMKNNGVVVFLDVPIGMLHFRLKNDAKRPLLTSQENLKTFIESSLITRKPIYNQADLIVDASLNKSELMEKIINFYLQKQSL